RLEVAAWIEALDAAEKLRIDCEGVREGAVRGAGLLHDDLAVTLEDRGANLAHVLVDEGIERLFARQDPCARFPYADRAEGIGFARPPETWFRSFRTLQERRWGPLRLEGLTRGQAVDGLNDRPEHSGCSG